MQYFNSLPKLLYTNKNGVSIVLTNLLARSDLVSNLLSNPNVYYKYDIKDDDTPEIIAHKYYDDSYRYWIVLLCNKMLDPIWDWPLSTSNLNKYIDDKYPAEERNALHSYIKTVTQLDNSSGTITTNTYVINETEYDALENTTETYTLPTGTVTVTVVKEALTNYDYEFRLNESKRNINILNKIYVNQIEEQFQEMMSK